MWWARGFARGVAGHSLDSGDLGLSLVEKVLQVPQIAIVEK
jgi:hypothetical protein